jgi:hypothetical protein
MRMLRAARRGLCGGLAAMAVAVGGVMVTPGQGRADWTCYLSWFNNLVCVWTAPGNPPPQCQTNMTIGGCVTPGKPCDRAGTPWTCGPSVSLSSCTC